MKIRKRIAALLAVAMVAALMPMTAFAESSNRLAYDVVKVAKDGTVDNELKLEVKDNFVADKNVFYVELVGAKWNKDEVAEATTEAGITWDVESDDTLAVTVTNLAKDEISIPVRAKDTVGDDDGKVWVVVDGWGSAVSSSKHELATVDGANVKVEVADPKTFYGRGENDVAKITLEEATEGQLSKAGKVTFTLEHDDYEFASGKATGLRGLAGKEVAGEVDKKDPQVITFDFTNVKSATRGVVEVELKVKTTLRAPATGDLDVEISGDAVEDKSYTVAKVAEYGVELKADKEYEFFAGRTEEVKFSVKETVKDSIAKGRYTEFALSDGVYFNSVPEGTEAVKDSDGRIYAFIAKVEKSEDFKVKLDIPANFEGDVVLSTDGRAFEDLEVTLATVKPAVKVTVEPMTVKVGMKEQVGGKIVIEELEKGALNKGKDITLQLEKASGIDLIGNPTVKVVEGDLRLGDVDTTTGAAITIPVNRASKEASTIEITNLKVRLDRTVPEGAYNLEVGGAAISKLAGTKLYGNDNILAEDFIFVGAKYTRPVTVFTIGKEEFTVNGKTEVMDAKAYVKDGRTMIPLRYLAKALGIDGDAIQFNSGIVTIFAEDKVIQVKNGDSNINVNGIIVPIVGSVEIVDGRTYVPVREIGNVFGLTGIWDPVAQTATFK